MKYKLCQPLLTIAAPRCSYCGWSSWRCPRYNRLWLQTQTIMHCKPWHHNFITFTFQRILGRSQFSALSHYDLRKHLVCHTGEKPLRLTLSLGCHALFLIFCFCLAGIENHIWKYLEMKESETDVVWWTSFGENVGNSTIKSRKKSLQLMARHGTHNHDN